MLRIKKSHAPVAESLHLTGSGLNSQKRLIQRSSQTNKKVVYIAGSITGVENYKEPFEEAAKEIKAMGFIPITPTWQPQGRQYKHYIDECLAILRDVDAAVFLPGWEDSNGATLEYGYCTTVDIPTINPHDYWDWAKALKEVLSDE